jgi:hypothetical protein
MHVELGWDLAVECLQELFELDRTVAAVQAADDLATGDVQRGVEARCPGAFVVVGGALRHPGKHRQDRGGAVQCLDLGFLVHAEHDRAFGRVQIQADDVADLLDELRVLGELPRVLAMRLKPERPPDPRDRGLIETDLGGHRTRRPVRRALWRRLERLDDYLLDLGVADLARLPRSRLVGQPVQAVLGKAIAPLAHRRVPDRQPLRDLGVLEPIGGQQHDPRAQRQRLRARRTPCPRLQPLTLSRIELDHGSHRVRHDRTLQLHAD